MDPRVDNRQTGRTTRGLKLAIERGVPYIVPTLQQMHYCWDIMPESKPFVCTAAEAFRTRLRGCTGVLVDHSCEVVMRFDALRELSSLINQVGGEFLRD